MIPSYPIFQGLQSYVPEIFSSTKERINAIVSNALESIGISRKNIVHYGSRVFLVYIFHLTMISILDFLLLKTAPLIAITTCVIYCLAFFALSLTVTSLYIPGFTYNNIFLKKYKTKLPIWLIKLNHFLGFNINIQDELGNTVLHYYGDLYRTQKHNDALLSLRGINPNNANMLGVTPLINAALKHNHLLILSLLKAKNTQVDLIGDINSDLNFRIGRQTETAFKIFMDNNLIFLGSPVYKQVITLFISQGADYDFIKEIHVPTWVTPLITGTMEKIRIQAKKTQDAAQKPFLNTFFPEVLSTLVLTFIPPPPDNKIQRETRERRINFKA